MSRSNVPAKSGRIRCAVYTRKSTEEGLDQAFNSLHAQREACEAYIKSQAGEGWVLIKTAYDDGGFSGGNLERPRLKQLLADVAAKAVDVIVVYKVDRLTRSLGDFAKIVEILDARGASFVSVTQAFNTTTSMGRLTLNVLLSFAQFEREVTGERIRDKIAASKAKGMWMGGMLPLGYDVSERRLVVNEAEAQVLRRIYRRYLDLKSVGQLKAELDAQGVRSKRWRSNKGREFGGTKITSGELSYLLRNRLYVGEVVHKDKVYPGQHPAIITRELFDEVQSLLGQNRQPWRSRPTRAGASPLARLLVDAEGCSMRPTFAYGRSGRLYRYYASEGAVAMKSHVVRRVAAPPLEALVLNRLRHWSGTPALGWAVAEALIQQVQLRSQAIDLTIELSALHKLAAVHHSEMAARLDGRDSIVALTDTAICVRVGVKPVFRGGAVNAPDGLRTTTSKAQPNRALTASLRKAQLVLMEANAGPLCTHADLNSANVPVGFYDRMLFPLAFLAPDIQRAILQGRQPPSLTLQRTLEKSPPLSWGDQRKAFGFDPNPG